MRALFVCLLLCGCYSLPEGTAKCNAEYQRVYNSHPDHFWGLRYAHDAFERCMSAK